MNERKKKPLHHSLGLSFQSSLHLFNVVFLGEVRCLSQISDVIKQQLTEKSLEV